jgi:hypothetical protein
MAQTELNRYDAIALIRTRLNYLNRKKHKVEHCMRYLAEIKRLIVILERDKEI